MFLKQVYTFIADWVTATAIRSMIYLDVLNR